ncbi:MAG: hypothetical protein JXA87_05825 [Thermoleophilia bacterium]|nr:hypothetical protein [Thermoleophilia bacterium]
MVKVEIDPGVCGHKTTVKAVGGEAYAVQIEVDSTCSHVQNMMAGLGEVNALQQIGLRNGLPSVLQTAYDHCAHAACPVPSALIKAIEVAAGLALPQDVSMRITKDE